MPRLPSRLMTKKRPWMVVPSKHLPLLPPFVFLFFLLSLLVRQLLSNRYVASPHPLSPSHPRLPLNITPTPIHWTFSSLRDRGTSTSRCIYNSSSSEYVLFPLSFGYRSSPSPHRATSDIFPIIFPSAASTAHLSPRFVHTPSIDM